MYLLLLSAVVDVAYTAGDGSGSMGFGCLSLPNVASQRDCSCDAAVCSRKLCEDAEGIWTDTCGSCQCDETALAEEDEDVTGFGCYDVTVHRCDCSPELCTEEACVATGDFWADACKTCQCGADNGGIVDTVLDIAGGASTSSNEEKGDINQGLESKGKGHGCYDSTVHECQCSDELCGQAACEAFGDVWTDQCRSCQCKELTSAKGWGCFNIGECSCDSDVCAPDSCESAGGLWTDQCRECHCADTGALDGAVANGNGDGYPQEQSSSAAVAAVSDAIVTGNVCFILLSSYYYISH